MKNRIGIVLVNYNGIKDTKDCIESIRKSTFLNYVIYVVDNDSSDKFVLRKEYENCSDVEILVSDTNAGFAGGCNIAIREIIDNGEFDYIFLLNNDTTVSENSLEVLLSVAENNKDAGIITCKINYYFNKNKVWFSGSKYSTVLGNAKHILSDKKIGIKKIPFATGCVQLIPVSVIKKVGLMDEKYFLYSEDLDYCRKIIRYGYKIYYTDNTVIYHKVNVTTGKDSPLQQYYSTRSRFLFIKQNVCPVFKPVAYLRLHCSNLYALIRKRRIGSIMRRAYRDFKAGNFGKSEMKF